MNKTHTAIVTGASGGIGKAICISLAKEGYNIVVHYNSNQNDADKLVQEIKKYSNAVSVKADLSITESAKDLYDKAAQYFGNIDTIICAAGVAHYDSFESLTPDQYRRVMDINLGSHMYLIANALPQMRQKSYGRIVVISSIWGEVGASWEVLYSTTKAGLIGMSKALSKEVASYGITVNAVTPGVINTKMLDKFSDSEKQDLLKEIPIGRFGTPHDVANAVCFLCSDKASYITGATIEVNGGFGK